MRMVALLRGINVGGNRKVPMRELAALAADLGFTEVTTYLQSGNLIFDSRLAAPQVASRLEAAIARHFGFSVAIVVRTAAQWKRYASGSPFPEAERARPHLLQLGLSQGAVSPKMASPLAERASAGERIKIVGDALWVDFAKSIGRSKLTPALFDKAVGQPVTMRNWKTVIAVAEMLAPS